MAVNWVDAAWWRAHADDADLVPVDARTAEAYAQGHLPRARHFDPTLFAPTASSAEATAKFVQQLEWAFSALGVGEDSHVLVYEQGFDVRAARAALAFEYAGHRRISILEGGADALGDALTARIDPLTPTRYRARPVAGLLVSAQELAQRAAGVRVLDTRRRAEYLGLETRSGRRGRIPGALHRDSTDNLRDGGYKPADELRSELAALGLQGDERVVTYCGGGGRAAHSYYALKRAGFGDVGVYLPSWGEWGKRDDLPVEIGDLQAPPDRLAS